MAELKNSEQSRSEKLQNKLMPLFDAFESRTTNQFVTDRQLAVLEAYPNWDEHLADKIKIIKRMGKRVEDSLNAKLFKSIGERFSVSSKLNFFADPNMSKVCFDQRISQSGKGDVMPVRICIPLDKLISMPPMEVYALILAASYAAVQNTLESGENKYQHIDLAHIDAHNHGTDQEKAEEKVKQTAENEKNYQKADKLLTAYLEGFLKNNFGEYFTEFESISKVISADILEDLSPEEIEKFMNITFNMSSLDETAVEKLAVFTGKDLSELMQELRRDAEFEKAKSFWKDRDKQPEAISESKQYQALMSDGLKGDFEKLLKEDEKNGFGSESTIKKFCENFISTYLGANGLKTVELTFKSRNDMGAFIDKGDKHVINIDPSRITSVSELVSTLAHELTHAKDSGLNKAANKTTDEGFGLHNNISSNISESKLDRGSPEFKLLKELNIYCYRVNPNERRGRHGELAGLKFMSELATSDKAKAQLTESLGEYIRYQEETVEVLKKMQDDTFVADLQARVDAVLASGISVEDKTRIGERMAYLQEMRKEKDAINHAMEEEAIKWAEKMDEKALVESQVYGMA